MKDHANFLRAAAILTRSHPGIYYFLVGAQVDCHNAELNALISELGLRRNVRLLGRRHDMDKVSAALDVACSSSAYGEGFPNVIGEAMSCAVPCVVTDVGDSARIVADTGRVVPPEAPIALATALRDLVEGSAQTRCALGVRARERIVQHFSLDAITQQYEELYTHIYGENAHRMVLAPPIRAGQR
jgi:glycosyltransferase involved in cell wall biosynthesis